MQDDLLATYKAAVEGRLRQALMRHRKIDPMAATGPIVDIQVREERELLARHAATNPAFEDFLDPLSAWLDEQRQKWKRG